MKINKKEIILSFIICFIAVIFSLKIEPVDAYTCKGVCLNESEFKTKVPRGTACYGDVKDSATGKLETNYCPSTNQLCCDMASGTTCKSAGNGPCSKNENCCAGSNCVNNVCTSDPSSYYNTTAPATTTGVAANGECTEDSQCSSKKCNIIDAGSGMGVCSSVTADIPVTLGDPSSSTPPSITTPTSTSSVVAPKTPGTTSNPTTPTGASGGGWSLQNISKYGLPGGSVRGIVENVLAWILGIFGFLGVLGFIISGLIYILSTGDDEMITKAKAAMKWSIVGVVVGLVGFVIIQAIDFALRAYSSF